MKDLDIGILTQYVKDNICHFHQNRIECLKKLSLKKVLKRKNPYLFKAKNCLTPDEIIRGITDAYISSNEETVFGNWLEELAIFVNTETFGGWKSGIKGIDLEFNDSGNRCIVSIKSGPNWGNSSQIAKMKTDFTNAKKTLRTSHSNLHIVAVNGCCYGQDRNPDKGDYFKYCGQDFWTFISGNESLYVDLIQPLGFEAKHKNDAFLIEYSKAITVIMREFINDFCTPQGAINWSKLVEYNSSGQLSKSIEK